MTWREQAAEIIQGATKGLPLDATLAERKQAVDAARPYWGGCSWPRKAWQAARRDYLVKYGYQPRTKKSTEARADGLPLFDLAAQDREG